MKKVLAKDVDPGDYIELFGKGYHARYINYYGKVVSLKLQPEDEPLSPFYANDAVYIELGQNEEVWVGKQNKMDTSCSVGVGNGSGNLFVHGSYEAVKVVQTLILEHEELLKKLLAERDKLWLSPTDEMVQAAIDELRKLLTEWEQNPESWVCDFEDINDNDLSDIAVFVLQAVASKLPKE